MKTKMMLLMMALAPLTAFAQKRVVSLSDGQPVVFAYAFSDDGTLLGTTDGEGLLPDGLGEADSVWVSQAAYHPQKVSLRDAAPVRLSPVGYETAPAEPDQQGKDYLLLRTYYRQFVTGSHGPVMVVDGVKDVYCSLKNGKRKEHAVWSRRRELQEMPAGEQKLSHLGSGSEAVSEFSPYDMVGRKQEDRQRSLIDKGLAFMHRDAATRTTEMQVDGGKAMMGMSLPLPLTGFTLKDVKVTEVFDKAESPTLWNLRRRQSCVRMQFRNKESREKTSGYQYLEEYMLERSLVTKKEMKAMMKKAEDTTGNCPVPDGVPQMLPPLQASWQ